MAFESEALFPEPVRNYPVTPRVEFMDVRDIEAQLAYELALERVAHEQGRTALFSLALDGSMQLPEEVR